MEIMCWILGTVSISVGLWVLIVNWRALVLSMVTRQRDIVWCRWLIDYANKDATLFFLFCALCIGLWNYYVCRLVASRGLQVYKIHGKINWQQG